MAHVLHPKATILSDNDIVQICELLQMLLTFGPQIKITQAKLRQSRQDIKYLFEYTSLLAVSCTISM